MYWKPSRLLHLELCIMSNKGRDSKVSLMMDQGPAELIRQATLILHH